MITHNPLHRSVRAAFPHTAPASGEDAHSPQRVGMANGGGRKPAVNEPIHSFPGDPFPAPAHFERMVPVMAYLKSKVLDGLQVGRHPVIANKSAHHRAEPFPLLGNGLVPAPAQFGLDLLKFPAHPFLGCPANDRIHPIASLLPTNVGEAQEVECLRPILAAPETVRSRVRPKLDQPRLFRMQRQTELLESLLEFGQTPLRRRSALKSDHEVVRPPYDDHVAAEAVRLSPVIDPEVEYVMKENVRQQRGDDPALRRSLIDSLPSPLLQHAGLEPFADQTHDAQISDAMLDELHEPSVVNRVEEPSNVRIDNPVHFLRQHPDVKRIQALVLAAPRPVAVREPEKLRFVDRIENHDTCVLHDLVLKHRHPERPLFSISLRNVSSLDGLCSVSPSFQPGGEISKASFQILPVLLPRHPIDTARGLPLEAEIRLPQGVHAGDVMHEARELELSLSDCNLTYSPQRALHPFPALYPASVLLGRVPLGQSASLHPLRHRLSSGFVRGLRRYYRSVRLPLLVHHRRAPFGFPTRPWRLPKASSGSPGSRASCFRACDGSPTPRSPSVSSPSDTADVAFRTPLERRHSGLSLTRLNTMPAHSSHNASRLNLRTAVHVQVRRGRLALRRAELSSAYNSPV